MFLNHASDVHRRARNKRQQMMAHEKVSDHEVSNRGKIKRDAGGSNTCLQVGGTSCHSQDEDSSVASSLFSHSEKGPVGSSMNESINFDPSMQRKIAANPENYESSDEDSLFSRSAGSEAAMTPAGANANETFKLAPPSSINDVEMNTPPVFAGVGCHDDSSSFSLFSQSDLDLSDHDTMPCIDQQMFMSESTDMPSPDDQEKLKKPVYETFEPPAYKPGEESDFDSSDEGSLFSLGEQEDGNPPFCHLQNKVIPRKKSCLTSLGSPIIPRKKSSLSPVEATMPVNKGPNRRFFTVARQSRDRALHPVHGAKEMVKSKGRVSIVVDINQPKCVGRSARAMKVRRPQEELSRNEIGSKTSSKGKTEESIPSWQKSYKEKQWDREFSKLRQFIKGHGHCEVPDGHTLSGWIGRQQKVCQRWLRNSYNPIEEISDIEFQTFVHIFRLHKVGFEWGSRIQHRISGAILDWSNMLDPCQRKILLEYGKSSSPSIARFEAKAMVERDASSCDEGCEFNDAWLETKRTKTNDKKRSRDKGDDHDRIKNRRRGENDKVRPLTNDHFRDEKQQTLSWNSTAHIQSSTREMRSERTSTIWKQIFEIHRKNLNINNFATVSSNQRCWFDLHYVMAASTPNEHVSSTVTCSVESSSEMGLSRSHESESERHCKGATISDSESQVKSHVMHEASPVETALRVRHNSRKKSSHVADAENDSMIDMAISVKVPEVNSSKQKRWFDLENAESSLTNASNKFQTVVRKTESEKQTYASNLESTVIEGRSPAPHVVTSHERFHVVATEIDTEKRKTSFKHCPSEITMADNQSHSATSIVISNSNANGEMRVVPMADKADKRAGPQTSKPEQPYTNSSQYKHPILGPKVAKISNEPSEEFVGWSVRRMPRKDGGSYCYYYSPQMGFRFRSKQDVKRFTKVIQEKGNEAAAMDECSRSLTRQKAPAKMKTPTVDGFFNNNVDSCTLQKQAGSIPGEGDEVYAAWRSPKKRKGPPVFYLGVVKSVSLSEGRCGPSRVYDIRFADGDELNDIDGSLVIPKHEYIYNNRKPIYMIGDKVYSAWWPASKTRKSSPSWYPGIVKARRELPRGGRYGPNIFYDILFDDGDEHENVEDHFVFLRDEYILATKQLVCNKSEWIGVRNVVDKSSSDHWAKIVGWYVASIDGQDQPFSLLSDALRAYDSYTVMRLGVKTKETDLNLPEEWIFSTSPGGPVRREGSTESPGYSMPRHTAEATEHSDSSCGTPICGDSIIRKNPSSLPLKHQCNVLKRNIVKSSTKHIVCKDGDSLETQIEGSRACDTNSDRFQNYEETSTEVSRKKPTYKKGEKIYALWSGGTQKWYPGRIWDIKVLSKIYDYGAVRTFDVVYDDGDTETDLKEIFVMKKADYELCTMKKEKDWIGVKNVTDPNSHDDFARAVGWYEVNIDGSNHVFPSLSDAMRFYDMNLVKRRGCRSHVLDSELNFPDEHK